MHALQSPALGSMKLLKTVGGKSGAVSGKDDAAVVFS